MIYNNIDGSQGSTNQLLDLLQVVANPTVYEQKIKSLQDAIEENKKYVELIAPASDIVSLRNKLSDELEEAKAETKKAKDKASDIVAKAKGQAQAIISDAKEEAKKLLDEANYANSTAMNNKAEIDKKLSELSAATNNLASERARLAEESDKLNSALTEANDAKNSYFVLRKELIEKHTNFIKSL